MNEAKQALARLVARLAVGGNNALPSVAWIVACDDPRDGLDRLNGRQRYATAYTDRVLANDAAELLRAADLRWVTVTAYPVGN